MPETIGIYYSESASGHPERPIVLLHGAGSSHLVWPPLMRRLAGWTILALDLPGHGKSKSGTCNSIETYAEVLLDFLAEKRIYQVVLVGHSLGGAVALQVALRHPQLIAGLGLISTGAHFNLPPALYEDFQYAFAREKALQALEELAFSSASVQQAREKMMQHLRQANWMALEDDWQACAAFDIRARLPRLEVPAWLAVGAEDRLSPISDAQFLAAHLPLAKLQIVPRAGHFLPLEQPAALGEGFLAFLAALSTAGGRSTLQYSPG